MSRVKPRAAANTAAKPTSAAVSDRHLVEILEASGGLKDALAAAYVAVSQEPRAVDLLVSLADVQRRLGLIDDSLETLRQVLSVAPNHAAALTNLGLIESARGHHDDALDWFRQAIANAPDNAMVHYNHGNCLRRTGRHSEAEAAYREAIRLAPTLTEAHNNLGTLLRGLDRWDEAETSLQTAVTRCRDSFETHYNLAVVQQAQGKTAAAATTFALADALRPGVGTKVRQATLTPPIPASRSEIDRYRQRLLDRLSRLEADGATIEDPLRECDWTPFLFAYHGLDERPLQERIVRFFRGACRSLSADLTGGRKAGRHRRLRIGWASAYFRNHTIGHLFEGVLRQLAEADIELFVFQIGGANDPVAATIAGAADHHVILPAGLEAARQTIADAELDVLVYPEIGMDPTTYFLAYGRLAPIQLVGWGHPVTTGLDTIDGFLSADGFEVDGADGHYTERLIRLPQLLLRLPFPEAARTRIERSEFGFSANERIYLCAQSLFKYHPDFDAILGDILDSDPQAIVALVRGHRPHWNTVLARRLAAARPGTSARIRFLDHLNRDDFVRVHGAADVVLDTPHFSGGKTSLECLATGTPMITLPSRYLRGRLTAGFYRRMEIDQPVARDAADYARRAVEIAGDRAARHDLVATTRARHGVLFDDHASVEAFRQWLDQLVAESPAR